MPTPGAPHLPRRLLGRHNSQLACYLTQWVAELHAQPCHVVTTPARPTPLEHWGFAAGGDGLRLLLGSDGHFRKENFAAAMSELKSAEGAKAAAKVGSRHSPDLQRVLALLERRAPSLNQSHVAEFPQVAQLTFHAQARSHTDDRLRVRA